jgi:hypothetical protein
VVDRQVAKNISFGALYRRGFVAGLKRKTPLQEFVEGVFIEDHIEQQNAAIEKLIAAWHEGYKDAASYRDKLAQVFP